MLIDASKHSYLRRSDALESTQIPQLQYAGLRRQEISAYAGKNLDSYLRGEDSSAEGGDAAGRLFELMSVGLPPFDTRPFSAPATREQGAPLGGERTRDAGETVVTRVGARARAVD